ncbi:MAG: MerR family transcriptional regulator [Deltaproteobacteria bacterium]|nr:MerR family transcriptional regulator [Deltaproteobacteria bacterium]
MRTAARLYRVREVLETVGISRRTLRVYEEVGLIAAADEEKGVPLYSDEAIEALRRAQRLRADLGVNLAGVQVILDMRARIEELQRGLDEVVHFVQTELREEMDRYLRREAKALVPKHLAPPPRPRDE